jgi:hypothetical protein
MKSHRIAYGKSRPAPDDLTKSTIVAEGDRTIATYRPEIEALFTGLGDAIRCFEALQQRRLKLYPQLLAEVPAMARRGWFISGYFGSSEIDELASICGTVIPAALDRRIADMYRSSLAEHGKSLTHDYPTRTFAIQPAIAAHERREYALSVPIFFAQAEGIFYDRAQKYIFRNEKGKNIRDAAKKQLAALAQDIDPHDTFSRLTEIMWQPFANA